MTKVAIFRDSQGEYRGFQVLGHSGYGVEGEDIVCSSISTLTITTLNALEELTKQEIAVESDEERPTIKCRIIGSVSPDAKLLMDAYCLGLQSLVKSGYDDYFQLFFKEV